MIDRNQRWRIAGADEPPLGDSLDWDRWARRLASAAHDGSPPLRASAPPAAAKHAAVERVRCFRTRITANLERLVEELYEEAERLNDQAADILLFTESV